MPRNSSQLLSDDDLLVMMRDNNRAAFEEIYNKYWSKLYLSAYNILRDRAASEDIVQEIMVQLWVKRNSLAVESLSPYLYQAVRFQVFKFIKRNKVHHYSLQAVEDIAVDNEAESNLTIMEIRRKLDVGIAELPEKCRQVFTLSRKNQLSTKEIATLLNITPKTVENQLTIAIRRIRSSMGNIFSLLILILPIRF